MAKDLKATLNALAEIDAHVAHVGLGTKNDPDLNELAWSVHNRLGIVRDLARDQARV
jgi:hypothetical protein